MKKEADEDIEDKVNRYIGFILNVINLYFKLFYSNFRKTKKK